MAKLTEYPAATSFDSGDILIKDGTNGTKKISVDDASVNFIEIANQTVDSSLVPTIDDCVLITNDTDGVRKMLVSDISGNAHSRELTYSQYQALSNAEKTNGTTYYVTDDPNDSSSGGGGMNYSLSEQIIGEWVDGNALYQRTFPIVANDAWIDISACNINEIIDIGGNWVTTSGASIPVTMFAGTEWYSFVDLEIVNERMRLRQLGWEFSSGYITLQYTKTS